MEKAYKGTVWTLPDDFISFNRFADVLYRLDRSSSPGWPYVLQKPTIGEWLGFDGIEFDYCQVQSLWCDVQAVIIGHFETFYRVFIKQEPHSKAKAEEGRWRLIVASPLCVQVVWQMLFAYQNDLEIEKCYDIPSQQGVVLCGGGWKVYRRLWQSRGYDTGLDKRAWDWTAPKWAIDYDLEFRYRMGRGENMACWYSIAKRLYDDMFEHPTLRLSDGSMYQQVVGGVMKSGCVNTISTNSHIQVMIHMMACWDQGVDHYPLCVACGDDTLQKKSQAIDISSYAKYGAIVKSASDELEFVGHEFLAGGPEPLYGEKHLVKLQHVKEEELAEYFDSMLRLYAHSSNFSLWESLSRLLGVSDKVLSKDSYLYWYDVSDD